MRKSRGRLFGVCTILLIAFFVLACLVGFSACGGGESDDDKKDNPTEQTATVSSVTISPSSLELQMGETETGTLTATVKMSDNTNSTTQTVNWKSSDTSVATVTSTGYTTTVTALKDGTTSITASAGSVTSNVCTVTVTAAYVPSECETNGHALVGTYANSAWTYACSVCGDDVVLGENTHVKSLKLEATDYDSLSAAGEWNSEYVADVTPLIDVATAITMTGDVDIENCAKDMILNANITVTNYWTFNVCTEMTLDLNGHSITVDGNYNWYVVQVGDDNVYGNLTVCDNSTNHEGKISSPGVYIIGVYGTANEDGKTSVFTLESGTIEGTGTTTDYVIYTSGNSSYGAEVINIEGGTVKSTGASGYAIQLNNGTLNVSDGTISGYYGVTLFGLVSSGKDVTVNVTGGTIEGTAYGIAVNGLSQYGMEVINIEGGKISGTVTGIFFTNGKLTVTGGEISGGTGIEIRGGTLNISGATVTATGTEKKVVWGTNNGAISSGYAIANTHSDSYSEASVTIGENVTLTGGVYTAVFDETDLLWAAAFDEVSIILEDDITLSNTLEISTTVALDLNGKSLSFSGDVVVVEEGGSLTVADSSDAGLGEIKCTYPTAADSDDYAAIKNSGTLVIEGGHIYGGLWSIENLSGGNLTINAGTIGGKRSENDSVPYAALVNYGTAAINGGTLLGGNGSDRYEDEDGNYDGVAVSNVSGTLTIGTKDGNGPTITYEGQGSSTSDNWWAEALSMWAAAQ